MKAKAIVTGSNEDRLDRLFECLTSTDRRYLLGCLHDRAPASESQEELAVTLAAKKLDTSPEELSTEELERELNALKHIHLPKLEDAGLISRDADGDAVALSTHPAYRDDTIRSVIADEVSGEATSLDELFRALSDSRRRTVLDVLCHQVQPIDARILAREVAAKEHGESPEEVSKENVDLTLISLQYVHFPRLQRAGLIKYDADEEIVSFEGHPVLCVSWLPSELSPYFKQILKNDPISASS